MDTLIGWAVIILLGYLFFRPSKERREANKEEMRLARIECEKDVERTANRIERDRKAKERINSPEYKKKLEKWNKQIKTEKEAQRGQSKRRSKVFHQILVAEHPSSLEKRILIAYGNMSTLSDVVDEGILGGGIYRVFESDGMLPRGYNKNAELNYHHAICTLDDLITEWEMNRSQDYH